MKAIFHFILIVSLSLGTGIVQASSVVVDQVYNVRESVSWGFREARYDLKQWEMYDNGAAPALLSEFKGMGYTNDGGSYGTSADRALYQAELSWMKWAENNVIINQTYRQAWVPVLDYKLKPSMNINTGTWWYRVGYGGGGGGITKLVDKQLLIDVLETIGDDLDEDGQITLEDFDWSCLKRLTGNQIRNLFNILAAEAAAATQDPGIGQPLRDLGDAMADWVEKVTEYNTSPTKANLLDLAIDLREKAKFSRATSAKVADVYTRLFDSTVAPVMFAQVKGYKMSFEGSLRIAEGNWSTYAASWTQEGTQYVFVDFRTRSGKRLEIEDDEFPWVKIRNLNTWMWIQQDTERKSQIFYLESTKLYYHMTALYNSTGVRTGTKWLVYSSKTKKWQPTVNPFP